MSTFSNRRRLLPTQVDFSKVVSGSVAGVASFVALDGNGKLVLGNPADYISFGDITGVTAGNGLTGGGDANAVTLNVGEGTGITVSSDAIATNDSEIVHDNLSGFVANEHIDHSGVTITAGDGLTGGGTIASTRTLAVGQGTGISVSSDAIATNDSEIVHDSLSGFVANEHIDHSSVSITAGTGLSGGGTIASTRTLSTNDSEIVHDNLSGFVANEHIDHSGVTITAGDGLTGGGTIASTRTLAVGQGTGISVSSDAIATNDSEIVHDNLSGFVANEHIDHSGVSITAGDGLTGGGTIASTRTLAVGAGTGIDVAADEISVDVSDFMSNGSDNRVVTATGTDAMNAEANLTFDGSTLQVTTNSGLTTDQLLLYESADDFARLSFANSSDTTGDGGSFSHRFTIAAKPAVDASPEDAKLNIYYEDFGDIATFTGAGKVGIGTTDPKQNFVVMADDAVIRIANNVDGDGDNFSGRLEIAEDSDANGVMSHGGFVLFDGDAASGLGAGQMRIGVRNNSSTDVPLISIDRDATSANAIHIAPEGVGIGRTPTTYDFEVEGDIYATDDVVVSDDIFLGDKIIHLSDTDNHIAFGTDTQTFTTAGSTAISIDAAGIVSKPLQPAFGANLASNQTITAGSFQTLSFSEELYDINADFNTSTGIFTAPKVGRYLFTGVVECNSVDASAVDYILATLVVTGMDHRFGITDPDTHSADGDITLPFAIMVQMDANDTARIQVYSQSAGVTIDGDDPQHGSSFQGYFLG